MERVFGPKGLRVPERVQGVGDYPKGPKDFHDAKRLQSCSRSVRHKTILLWLKPSNDSNRDQEARVRKKH